jgi:hypothetical protein
MFSNSRAGGIDRYRFSPVDENLVSKPAECAQKGKSQKGRVEIRCTDLILGWVFHGSAIIEISAPIEF